MTGLIIFFGIILCAPTIITMIYFIMLYGKIAATKRNTDKINEALKAIIAQNNEKLKTAINNKDRL